MPLPAYTDGRGFITVWELTDEEFAAIQTSRQIRITTMGARFMPVLPEVFAAPVQTADAPLGENFPRLLQPIDHDSPPEHHLMCTCGHRFGWHSDEKHCPIIEGEYLNGFRMDRKFEDAD